MATLTDATDIANAALMEVGINPICFAGPNVPGVGRWPRWPRGLVEAAVIHRAALLGVMGTAGPSAKVACVNCSHRTSREVCIPVTDALRGLTCSG